MFPAFEEIRAPVGSLEMHPSSSTEYPVQKGPQDGEVWPGTFIENEHILCVFGQEQQKTRLTRPLPTVHCLRRELPVLNAMSSVPWTGHGTRKQSGASDECSASLKHMYILLL